MNVVVTICLDKIVHPSTHFYEFGPYEALIIPNNNRLTDMVGISVASK